MISGLRRSAATCKAFWVGHPEKGVVVFPKLHPGTEEFAFDEMNGR